MKITIKPITVEKAHSFISETKLLHSYYHELTFSGATERISFFWDCLAHSIATNKEDWNGLKLSDFGFVSDAAEQMQKELLKMQEESAFGRSITNLMANVK